jgi:hypothetical protein
MTAASTTPAAVQNVDHFQGARRRRAPGARLTRWSWTRAPWACASVLSAPPIENSGPGPAVGVSWLAEIWRW